MNILLVQAFLGGTEQPVFPLGLACVASSLSEHNVRIYDPNVSGDPLGELEDLLDGFSPDVIGLSIRNIDSTNKREVVFYYPYLKKIIDVIKAGRCSSSTIVAGGSGFSMFAREIMEDEQRIDFGILLEGEIAFNELLQNLSCPEKVRSVFFRRNGEIVFTGPGVQVDVNNTAPAYRCVASLDPYRKMRDAVGVETKRGCGFRCIYCIYGFLNGRALRLRAPERVVDEIELLVKEHGVERFTFVDSVFNAPQEHARDICREMIRRNIKVNWSAWFNEKGLTREFVELVI
ncbi:MAG: cobalamin-dependent protein, partial [Nitrospirae bacterium]|nr:cobalamin-dependent protein [Nitrospirota bacterium]